MLMQNRQYLHERVELSTRNLAELLVQSLIDKVRIFDDAIGRTVQELQSQLATGKQDDNRINRFLQIQLDQLPEVQAIHVMDEFGFVRWGRDVNPITPANSSDREYFKQHHASTESHLIVTQPIIGRVSGRWVVSFTRPYRYPDGRFAGVVMVSAKVSGFADMLARADTGKSGTAVMRHTSNMALIARHPPLDGPTGQPGHNKVSAEYRALVDSGQTTAMFHTPQSPDSVERTYAFRRPTNLPFTIAVGMASDEYLAPWRGEVIRIGLLLIAFLMSTLISAWLILRYWRIRWAAEQAFQQSEENLHRAQSVAHLGSWHLDIPSEKLTWSDETFRIFGIAPGSPMTLDRFLAYIHPDDVKNVTDSWCAALQGEPYNIEHRIIVDDEIRWVHERAQVDWASDGTPQTAIGTVHDVTERKRAEEQIHNFAYYDSLTQLPNRRMLTERLGLAMSSSKRTGCYGAVMLLDLDNFKPLNDTHGHAMGDLLLIEVAQRLTMCVREVDTVARLGGDEFVVMLASLNTDVKVSRDQALTIAEKIRAGLAKPYILASPVEGKPDNMIEHHCSSSIGVTLFIGQESGQHEIIKNADDAMYQAKEAGRNSVRFLDQTNK